MEPDVKPKTTRRRAQSAASTRARRGLCHCEECGAPLDEKQRYCVSCGARRRDAGCAGRRSYFATAGRRSRRGTGRAAGVLGSAGRRRCSSLWSCRSLSRSGSWSARAMRRQQRPASSPRRSRACRRAAGPRHRARLDRGGDPDRQRLHARQGLHGRAETLPVDGTDQAAVDAAKQAATGSGRRGRRDHQHLRVRVTPAPRRIPTSSSRASSRARARRPRPSASSRASSRTRGGLRQEERGR